MPHKRKTRVHYNPKNQVARRVQLSTAVPNVCVRPDYGSQLENSIPENATKAPPDQAATGNKFAVPQYNTLIRNRAELASLQKIRATVPPELSPRTKAAIAPKVSQKLNFAQSHSIFKDLVSLNVNDSLREMERPKVSNARSKDSTKSNIVEPILADYAEKVEHVQLIMPEPELQMDFPHEEFDFLRAYKRVYHN